MELKLLQPATQIALDRWCGSFHALQSLPHVKAELLAKRDEYPQHWRRVCFRPMTIDAAEARLSTAISALQQQFRDLEASNWQIYFRLAQSDDPRLVGAETELRVAMEKTALDMSGTIQNTVATILSIVELPLLP